MSKRVSVIMKSVASGRDILIPDFVKIVAALLPTVPHLLLLHQAETALLALV